VGPALAGGAAIFAFAAIPISGLTCVGGQQVGLGCNGGYALHWDLIHVNVSLLFVLAVTSLGVYSLFLGGWSANSKYSLLGGLRSSAQLISYEMAVAFALVGAVILAGSLELENIVLAQHDVWFVVLQPLAFLLYFTGALAETNRLPFDLPEAETELVAGYHTEYSSMRFGFYFLGEYINMIIVCSIATLVFLGGWLPLIPMDPLRLAGGAGGSRLVPRQGERAALRDDVAALDAAALPLRPADEPGLEGAAAAGPGQHRPHRRHRRRAGIVRSR